MESMRYNKRDSLFNQLFPHLLEIDSDANSNLKKRKNETDEKESNNRKEKENGNGNGNGNGKEGNSKGNMKSVLSWCAFVALCAAIIYFGV